MNSITSFEPAFWLATASAVGTVLTTVAALWLRVRRPRWHPSMIEISTADGQRIALTVSPDASSVEIGRRVTQAIEESHTGAASYPAPSVSA
jgi:hypothetical protein